MCQPAHRDNRVNGKDAKWAAKNAKVDLAFLAASWTAHSDEATLNHAMDWNHWVRFPTTYPPAGLLARKLTQLPSKVFLFDDRTCFLFPPNYLLPVFPGLLTFISARAEFDEGHLMTDMAAAESEVDLMLEIIDGSKRTEQSEDPVRYMFTDVCEAVRKVCCRPSFS